jgi:hypothetical protein
VTIQLAKAQFLNWPTAPGRARAAGGARPGLLMTHPGGSFLRRGVFTRGLGAPPRMLGEFSKLCSRADLCAAGSRQLLVSFGHCADIAEMAVPDPGRKFSQVSLLQN